MVVRFESLYGHDVNIKIDGELVKAHDPLFLNVNKTQYPNDPVSEEYAPFEFQWPIRDEKFKKIGARWEPLKLGCLYFLKN